MIPPSWIAVLVLSALLGATGLLLKGQIQTNFEHKLAAKEYRASIKRLGKDLKNQEAEKQRLSDLLSEREASIREHAQKAAANKDAARMAVADSPDLRRCSDVYWPADVVQRLRDGADSGLPDSSGKAAKASDR